MNCNVGEEEGPVCEKGGRGGAAARPFLPSLPPHLSSSSRLKCRREGGREEREAE